MSTIYHLLDEAEPFSERDGGAISRWAANVLRGGQEIILCPSFDDSWGFPAGRVEALPGWAHTHPVHPLLYRLPWPLQQLAYLAIFRPLLKRLQPGDLLYIHNRPECAAVLAPLARAQGFALVLHMHNSHINNARRGQRAALRRLPVAFCSEFLRSGFVSQWPEHDGLTTVVYNGADGAKYRAAEKQADNEGQSPPEVIFTGRLVAYKGAHVLLQAMRLLEQRGVSARCSIVGGSWFGKGRQTRYIRKLRQQLPSNTRMLGYHAGDALAALLRKADVFCCPSIWHDPFPLAPLEAMASGLPVVASRTGGLPEELAHGGGTLVEPNNPAALAEALQPYLEDPAYRREVGAAACRAFQNNFSWVSARRQYVAFLQSLQP